MILHIGAYSSKHIMFPFIEFVHQYFDEDEHFYILCSSDKIKLPYKNTITKDIFKEQKYFIEMMNKADKIILHGVWYEEIPKIYLKNTILFGKTLLAVWGGDFQSTDKIDEDRKWLFQNIKYIITGNLYLYNTIELDYATKTKRINCFLYPSNLFKEYPQKENKNKNTIYIQIGNSANPTNKHFEIFEYLSKHKDDNIIIYSPLSYGDKEYTKDVIKKGKEIFGDKFIPMETLLPFNEYIEFLSTIDIAIFNQKKQEAFGNIITLLGFGKKVYFDSQSEMKVLFREYDLNTFEIQTFNLSPISKKEKQHNYQVIKNRFSIHSLKKCLQNVFSYKF